jgi:hypothetical protein
MRTPRPAWKSSKGFALKGLPPIDVSRKALFVKVPPQHNREAPADGLGRG